MRGVLNGSLRNPKGLEINLIKESKVKNEKLIKFLKSEIKRLERPLNSPARERYNLFNETIRELNK